jgi:hypothetical protein
MKNLLQLFYRPIGAASILLVGACTLLAPFVCAQSIGPTINVCTSELVDSSNSVSQTICLIGNSSQLDSFTEVSSYDWNYFPLVDSNTSLSSSGGFQAWSGWAVRDSYGPGGTYASSGIDTTPVLNDVYTMSGQSGYCYDSSGLGGRRDWDDNPNIHYCVWTDPGGYRSLQGVVTLPGSEGLLYPKYVVMGVTYAPPGDGHNSPWGTSYVKYTGVTSVGTSSTNSSSFSNELGYGIQINASASGHIPLGQTGIDGSISLTYGQSTGYTQAQEDSTTVTTNKSSLIEYGTSGYPTYYPTVGTQSPELPHDYDVIRLWLNPELIFTAYPAGGNSDGFVVWHGFAVDPADLNGPDVLQVQVGCLNGHFTADHCSSQQTNLNRAWVTDQKSPTSGTAITAWGCSPQTAESPSICPNTQDAYEVLKSDPLAYNPGGSTYTLLDSVPLPLNTPDGRFTQSAFPPNPASYVAGQHYQHDVVQKNTRQQTQNNSTEIKSKVERSAKASIGFLTIFSLSATYTETDTVDQKNSWLSSLSQENTVTNAVSLNGSIGTNYVPADFVLYQDNFFGTFLCYPKNY